MSIKKATYTELEVHEGCGHNPPRKFDDFKEAYQYATKVSQEPHYLGGTTPVQLIRQEVRSTVWSFKNGEA